MPLLLSLRPLQWIKNLLLFAPFLFTVDEWWRPPEFAVASDLFPKSFVAFLLFCGLSSAIYLINDVIDRERDRLHPQKRMRPIASGRVGALPALAGSAFIVVASLSGAILLDMAFAIIAIAYVGISIGYSLVLKQIVLVDVFAVATGYVLRLAAGTVVIDAVTSPWIYMTMGLGALFLVLGKRYAELIVNPGAAPSQRPALEGYSASLLGHLVAISATSTIVAYALYTFTGDNLPDNHTMMLSVPFVVFGIFRYLYIVNVKSEGENPELAIFKDAALAADVAAWAISVFLILLLWGNVTG